MAALRQPSYLGAPAVLPADVVRRLDALAGRAPAAAQLSVEAPGLGPRAASRREVQLPPSDLIEWEAFFDAVGMALYRHRSLGGRGTFQEGYSDFYGADAELDDDALVYWKLANDVAHRVASPPLLTIAEEHSGLPGLCAPVDEAGAGFDYRQTVGLPPIFVRARPPQRP